MNRFGLIIKLYLFYYQSSKTKNTGALTIVCFLTIFKETILDKTKYQLKVQSNSLLNRLYNILGFSYETKRQETAY